MKNPRVEMQKDRCIYLLQDFVHPFSNAFGDHRISKERAIQDLFPSCIFIT